MSTTTNKSIENDLSEVTSKNALTTEDFDAGGVLPDPLWDEFWTDLIEQTPILDAVRTVQVGEKRGRIPTLDVGQRHRRPQDEGEWNENEAEFDVGSLDYYTEKGTVSWDIPQEITQNNPQGEALADQVLGLMTEAWAADVEDLAATGDEGAESAFESQNDGWITLAEEEDMDSVPADGNVLDNDVIIQAIAALDSRYRSRMSPALIVSEDQLLAYHYSLVDRETPLGDNVIMGEADVNPFSFPIIGSGLWPDDTAMFTDPDNLVYVLHRDLEVEMLDQSDKVAERDLHARYFMRGDDDFMIEHMDAGILVEDLGDPLGDLMNDDEVEEET